MWRRCRAHSRRGQRSAPAAQFEPVVDQGPQSLGQARFEAVDPVAEDLGEHLRDCAEQRVGGIAKFLNAVGDQSGGHARQIGENPRRSASDRNSALDFDIRRGR